MDAKLKTQKKTSTGIRSVTWWYQVTPSTITIMAAGIIISAVNIASGNLKSARNNI